MPNIPKYTKHRKINYTKLVLVPCWNGLCPAGGESYTKRGNSIYNTGFGCPAGNGIAKKKESVLGGVTSRLLSRGQSPSARLSSQMQTEKKERGKSDLVSFAARPNAEAQADLPPHGPRNASGIKPCGLRRSEARKDEENKVKNWPHQPPFSNETKPLASEAELMALVPDAAFSSSTPPARKYIRENKSNLCPTLTANMGTGGHNVPLLLDDNGIRKLTPRECFNLQGFPKDYQLPKHMTSELNDNIKNIGDKTRMSLRPERVILNPSDNFANTFTSVVKEIIYHGDHTRIRVSLLDQDNFILKVIK